MEQFKDRNLRASKDLQRRKALIDHLGRSMAELQDASEDVDEAAADLLGVNRTDLRLLGQLFSHGAMTAGGLAAASARSPGAVTTALDRLEGAGYARRVRDDADRRRVVVELTPEARTAIREIWGRIARDGKAVLAGYTTRELEAVMRFVRDAIAVQSRHAERIRAAGRRARRNGRTGGRPPRRGVDAG